MILERVDACSLYAAPFPFDTSLDELNAFFSEAGAIKCVRMRRHTQTKDFKGSVFVEFESEAIMNEVMGITYFLPGSVFGGCVSIS